VSLQGCEGAFGRRWAAKAFEFSPCFGHFVQDKGLYSALSGGHVGGEMWRIHVSLPKFSAFPVFIEDKKAGVFVVFMQIVVDAALFCAGDVYQLFQLCFDERFFARCGGDLCENCEGHCGLQC